MEPRAGLAAEFSHRIWPELRLNCTAELEHGSVPTRGLRNTQRFALGAVFVYQLALLARFEARQDLRSGLKAYLKGA